MHNDNHASPDPLDFVHRETLLEGLQARINSESLPEDERMRLLFLIADSKEIHARKLEADAKDQEWQEEVAAQYPEAFPRFTARLHEIENDHVITRDEWLLLWAEFFPELLETDEDFPD